jgi:uncharacterized protein (TIGR00725 family)
VRYVAVVGPGNSSREELEAAEETGRLLAERGAVVVCGGLGGAMESACRGARSSGGTTVGILPGTDRSDANPYVQIALPTGLAEGRNLLVVRSADAVIAVGGAYGTLSEIAFALRAGTPVVGLRTWELSRGGKPDEAVIRAASPSEAVELALEACG